MVKLNKIYTRTGDDGTTGLADGSRRKKHDLRVAAYGDGLNHAEDDPLASDIHPDAYVRNKAGGERELFRLWHESEVPRRLWIVRLLSKIGNNGPRLTVI